MVPYAPYAYGTIIRTIRVWYKICIWYRTFTLKVFCLPTVMKIDGEVGRNGGEGEL